MVSSVPCSVENFRVPDTAVIADDAESGLDLSFMRRTRCRGSAGSGRNTHLTGVTVKLGARRHRLGQ